MRKLLAHLYETDKIDQVVCWCFWAVLFALMVITFILFVGSLFFS